MACDLTLGRSLPCKDSVGGIAKVWFVNEGDLPLSAITYDVTNTDAVESVSGTPNAYEYDIKGGASLVQNITSDDVAGTSFYEQVLELTLRKLTIADHKELKLLVWGDPRVIIEDNNGNYFLAGLEHGMSVTGGTIVTGADLGELSGYTLTLTGREKIPANFMETDPATAGFTVVT